MTDFTTDDILKAIGVEIRRTRGAVNLIAVLVLLQAVLVGLWIVGVITVEFRPA